MADTWTPPSFAKEVWQPPEFAKPAADNQPEESSGVLQKLLSGYYTTPQMPEGMEVQGPGFMKIPGMEAAGEWIKNKGINTGNYYGGAIGSILGDLVSGAATGFDPRTAGLGEAPAKPIPKYEPPLPEVAKSPINIPKQLGPATTNLESTLGIPTGELPIKGQYQLPASKSNVPKLAGKTQDGSQIYLQFEGPEVTVNDVKSMFPGENISVIRFRKGDFRSDQSRFRIDVSDKKGNLSSVVAKKLGDQLGENFTDWNQGNYPINNGPVELPSAPLDVMHAQPKIPTHVDEINKIPPGQADVAPITNGKDIKPFRAEFSSPHIVMDNFPQTKGIIQPIMKANDEKYKWLATTEREFSSLSQGLSSQDRKALTYILNGEEVPGASPEIYARAEKAKNLLDSVWEMANDKSKSDIGFIDRYITHIKAQPEDFQSAVKSIWDNQFGKKSGISKVFSSGAPGKATGDVGDLFDKGIGNPNSPYTKTRANTLQDIETDYNRIIPTYLESMAKVIFDRPATDIAKDELKNIPESKLKEYLTGYIKNYTKYDSDAQLAGAWNSLANQIATINARSVISFNPVVHMYHAGQLPANIWPELGTKYSTIGITKFLQNPIQSYQELTKNGLFSNMIRPMRFQTPMQKFDSISYYMNMVESLVKGTGYYGFKQQALDKGMSEAEATMQAISKTKDATATVDPARMMRFFTPESNVAGGQLIRLGKQYKQIPAKLVEQFSRAAADFKSNPAKAARYIAGTGIAGAGTAAGIHTLHASPLSLISELSSVSPLGGQFTTVMGNIYKKLGKGDVGGALEDAMLWATPGGRSIKKMITP